jgi:REP element-mobilizing transposase RayT
MKLNPARYSSAVGDVWVMATFKIKYCHHLFDNKAVRELTDALINEAFQIYRIRHKKLAFDSDHAHMIIDMGLYGKPEIAKKIKGYVAKNIFNIMPWLKNDKRDGGYFWDSGFWNPAYDIRNIGNMNFYLRYLDKQKYSSKHQTMLTAF